MSTKKELIQAIVARLQEISSRVFNMPNAPLNRHSLQTILGDENYAIAFGSLPYSAVITLNLSGVSLSKVLGNHTEEALVDVKAMVDGITEERIAELVEAHKPYSRTANDEKYDQSLEVSNKARKTLDLTTAGTADENVMKHFASIVERAHALLGASIMMPRDDYSYMDKMTVDYTITDMLETVREHAMYQTNAKLAAKCKELVVELDALQLANRGTQLGDTNIVIGQLPNVKPRPKFSAAGLIENGDHYDVVLAKAIQFKYGVSNIIPLGVVIDPTTIKFVSKVDGIVPVAIRNHPTFGTMIMFISESVDAVKVEADSIVGHIERI